MSVTEIIKEVVEGKLSLPYLVADLPEADKALTDGKFHDWPIIIRTHSDTPSYRTQRTGALITDYRHRFYVLKPMSEIDMKPELIDQAKDELYPWVHRIFNQIRLHEGVQTQQYLPSISEPLPIKGLFSSHMVGWSFRLTVPWQEDYCATELIGKP